MVLECTGMSACKPVWTPVAHNSQLSETSPDDNQSIPEMVIEGHQVSYLTVIGSLMYLMLGTHPDIRYMVGTHSVTLGPGRDECRLKSLAEGS